MHCTRCQDALLLDTINPLRTRVTMFQLFHKKFITCIWRRYSNIVTPLHVVSFYEFVHLQKDIIPDLCIKLRELLQPLGGFGRIYVAEEGINAQISLPSDKLDSLSEKMSSIGLFSKLYFNISTSPGTGAFRKLIVKKRERIVSDGLPTHSYDINNQPTYLEPEQFHKELEQNFNSSKHLTLLDTRNTYESRIGYFKGSTFLSSETFKEFIQKMLKFIKTIDKTDPIYMYCTSGIRCSKAGAILRSHGHHDIRMVRIFILSRLY